jgi:dihydroorotate dehydrogenase
MYQVIRRILFLLPAETAHYFSMNIFKALCSISLLRKFLARLFAFKTPSTDRLQAFRLSFKNPIGLGAGFDKNAKYLDVLNTLGFGFVEIGTVTPKPQAGNEKPRLFRLPKDKALINRMGFNNEGVQEITRRLKKWREQSEISNQKSTIRNSQLTTPMLIGGNIGKNKMTPNEEAWKDYETCFKELHPYVDYFVVNVSSPNTPGLRALQEKESLRKILVHLQMINNGKAKAKPILLKIAPDLTQEQIDDVIDLALEIKLDGLVVSNTTISRTGLSAASEKISKEAGGLSGMPLKEKNTEIINYLSQQTKGQLPIIASGGVFNAADAKEKLDAGAVLVQVWTGFIYEGPFIVRNILKNL